MATLGELAVVLGITGTMTATALPRILTGLDDNRVAGAARYVSSRLAEARMEAVAGAREVAIRFTATPGGVYRFTVYVDGNNNGVLTRDIQRGIDRPVRGPETLRDNFKSVDFGVQPGVPGLDGGAPPAGDPIKFGASNSVSFSTLGSGTPGTLYITGASGAQYAVRVVGVTGKIRAYRFNRHTGKWLPM